MKKVFFLVSFILVSGFFINHAYALKSYNASKSNTAATSIVKNDIGESIDAAKLEALEIVDQMLSQMKESKSKNRSTDDKIKVTPLDTTMESLAGSSFDEVTYTIKVTVKIEDE